MPSPCKPIDCGLLPALSVTDKVPVIPNWAAVGAKVTPILQFAPPAKLKGGAPQSLVLAALTENWALALIAVTFRSRVPVLDRLTSSELLAPTLTAPKSRGSGVRTAVGAAIPVPLRDVVALP